MRCDECCYSSTNSYLHKYTFICEGYANGYRILSYRSQEDMDFVSKCRNYCSRQKELFSFIDD